MVAPAILLAARWDRRFRLSTLARFGPPGGLYGTDSVAALMDGFTIAMASPGAIATSPEDGPFWFQVVLPGSRVATAVPLTTKVPPGDATTSPEPSVIGVWNVPPAGR